MKSIQPKHNPTYGKPALVAPPMIQRTVEFDTVEPVNALGIDETKDFQTWYTVYQETPHLWIGLGHKRVTFSSNEPNAFYRAWVRNEP